MATGHIRARGKSLEVRVHIGAGRYETRTIGWQGTKTATRQAAERELRKLLDENDQGSTAGADKTVAQLVARWRKNSVAEWSPRTRETYDCYVRIHVLPTLGKKKLHEVRPDMLDDLYTELRTTKGLSPASVRKVHVIIRRAFSDAVRWGWVGVNPAVAARPPAMRLPDLAPPTVDEVRLLLERALVDDPDLAVFLAVAADTGARRGEVCGLRWSDIDLDDAELVISRSVAIDLGGVLVKDTKTHQARRIALGDPLVEVLRAHHARTLDRAKAMRAKLPSDAYVFSSPADFMRPWRPDTATHRFVRVRSRCGCKDESGKRATTCAVPDHQRVRRVRLHDFRHAMITDWLSGGEDVRTVMGRSGHASLQTLTRYAHFVPARDREGAKRLGDRHQ